MQRNQDTPLYTACQQRALQRVQDLLHQGADVNAVCSGGNTPVHAAAVSGSIAVLEAVTAPELGADLNARNDWGLTPLLAAIDAAPSNRGADYAGVVALLLNRGADLTLKNERGETALRVAAEYLLVDVIKSFLTHPRSGELTAAALVRAALAATEGLDAAPSPAQQLLVLQVFTRLYTAALAVDPAAALLAEQLLLRVLHTQSQQGNFYAVSVAVLALTRVVARHEELGAREDRLGAWQQQLDQQTQGLLQRDREMSERQQQLAAREREIEQQQEEIRQKRQQLKQKRQQLKQQREQLKQQQWEFAQQQSEAANARMLAAAPGGVSASREGQTGDVMLAQQQSVDESTAKEDSESTAGDLISFYPVDQVGYPDSYINRLQPSSGRSQRQQGQPAAAVADGRRRQGQQVEFVQSFGRAHRPPSSSSNPVIIIRHDADTHTMAHRRTAAAVLKGRAGGGAAESLSEVSTILHESRLA